MRDHVRFFLNGRPQSVHGEDVRRTVSEFLRDKLVQLGTKVVCSEGDCGACTALLSRARGNRITYEPVDTCILFVHQIDGTHLVTVEGLNQNGMLHPVQQTLIDHHGSQCGFCTPGMVMALAGWLAAGCPRNEASPRIALTGNLCRCTGYQSIFEAAEAIAKAPHSPVVTQALSVEELQALRREPLRVESDDFHYFAPTSLQDAVEFKAEHPEAVIIAGATEIGVWRNKRGYDPKVLLSLSRVAELDAIRATERQMSFGANVTWSRVENAVAEPLPEFHRIVQRFGSPQIRNAATLVGNVANGSPIGDSLGLLTVLDAEVEVASVRGMRTRPLNGFYTGYKQKDMAADEFITRVHLQLPHPRDRIHLSKVSRRHDMDIATFGAAIRLREADGIIEDAAIALTGVATTVIRVPAVEEFLVGEPVEERTFRDAGKRLRAEINPIKDVRGTQDFRLQLAENCLLRFYYQQLANGTEPHSA